MICYESTSFFEKNFIVRLFIVTLRIIVAFALIGDLQREGCD